jgi:Restriction endonuclease
MRQDAQARRNALTEEQRAILYKQEYAKRKAKGYHIEYRAKNGDKIRQYNAEYARLHPEKKAEREGRRRAWKMKSPAVAKIDRLAIIERDASTCYLCLRVLALNEVTMDHVVPLSKGGPHTPENLRVACMSCNTRKGASMPAHNTD